MAWSDEARRAAAAARRIKARAGKNPNNARKAAMLSVGHSGGYFASRARVAREFALSRAKFEGTRGMDMHTRNLYARMYAVGNIVKDIKKRGL